jgi:hypothetical protein
MSIPGLKTHVRLASVAKLEEEANKKETPIKIKENSKLITK